MDAYSYEDVIPSLVPNTTMQKMFINGVHKVYTITPNENYVLHDNRLDTYADYDEEGNPIGEVTLGYYSGTKTVYYNYDFDNVVVGTDGNTTVNKIGAYELYAILATEVPSDQIYNNPNNTEKI